MCSRFGAAVVVVMPRSFLLLCPCVVVFLSRLEQLPCCRQLPRCIVPAFSRKVPHLKFTSGSRHPVVLYTTLCSTLVYYAGSDSVSTVTAQPAWLSFSLARKTFLGLYVLPEALTLSSKASFLITVFLGIS